MANTEGERKAGFSNAQLDTLSKIWDLQVGQRRMLIAVAGSELIDSSPHKDDLLVSYGGITQERIDEFNEVQQVYGTGFHTDENGNLYWTGTIKLSSDSEEENPTEQTVNTAVSETSPKNK
ncbi:MAG: hypothetical protein Q7K55_09315 [Candidatus Levybacteria bacterium]|nr:hypothetical protein [Candidatus Levybacteria bacterium]